MESIFVVVCTDGKIWVCSNPANAKAVANSSHVYEIAPPGEFAIQLCTVSGAGSPYTVTSAGSATQSDGRLKVSK